MGSGPFKFVSYETGQSIKGERNPDYYHKGLPYLDGFIGIFADKQATRVDAIRSDRAAIEFRGLPPSARDELVKALGDKITVQTSDWNCGSVVTPNHKKKPFDDVRVRRALTLAIDRWHGAPALVEDRRSCAPSAASSFPARRWPRPRRNCSRSPAIWPDIEKSRAEARRLLKEAGAEGLSFELLNRNVDQPYKYLGIWLVDEWSKIGLKVTQRVVPTGPWFEAMRSGNFDVRLEGNCQSVVNPVLDVSKYLPRSVYHRAITAISTTRSEVDLYDKMLRETDPAKQRALMREFEKHALDDQAHEIMSCGGTGSSAPLLRQGLEDQPEPFPQPGSGDDLARQVGEYDRGRDRWTKPLLEVKGLHMYFPVTEGMVVHRKIGEVKAVDGIDFCGPARRDPGPRRRERLRQDDDRPLHPAARAADRWRDPL